jgi:hypothetical protein
LRVGS